MKRVVVTFLLLIAVIGVWSLVFLFCRPGPSSPLERGSMDARSSVERVVISRPAFFPKPFEYPELPALPAESEGPDKKTRPLKDAIPDEWILSFFNLNDMRAFFKFAEEQGVEVLDSTDLGYAVRIRAVLEELHRLLKEGPVPVEHAPNFYVRSPRLVEGKDPQAPEGDYIGFGDLALRWLGVSGDNKAWGKGITIAVLDTGVVAHPSLLGKNITQIVAGGGESIADGDYHGHGTAVASLIAGNSDDLMGLSPASSILSVRVLSENGIGDAFTLAKGIVEAVDRGAKVINLCLGSNGDSFLLERAVNYAEEKGVAVVASAGNDSVEGVLYPARYENVVAVSAVDADGRHPYFANRGPEVDITAPGVGVTAAWTGDEIVSFSGTSAATPFVSAALAMLMAEDPSLSASDAVEILRSYSNDTGMPGSDDEYGQGIMSIDRIRERNDDGIYDVAAAGIHVGPSPSGNGDLVVVLSAQNRGTEELAEVDVNVEVNGVPLAWSFFSVGVGDTVSDELIISREELEKADEINIRWTAEISGKEDRDRSDNTRKAMIGFLDPP